MEATMERKRFFTTRNITYLAVLTALIVAFQLVSSLLPLPSGVSLNLTLVPIVLGGIMLGFSGGAFLGLTFAVIVTIMSIFYRPTDMMILIIGSPAALIFFILSTLLRGFLAGVLPELVFRLVARKNDHAATIAAAATAPVVNTGVFILSTMAIFGILSGAIEMNAMEFFKFVVLTLAGINFLIEFAINIILSPVIYSVVKVVGMRKSAHSNIEKKQDTQ